MKTHSHQAYLSQIANTYLEYSTASIVQLEVWKSIWITRVYIFPRWRKMLGWKAREDGFQFWISSTIELCTSLKFDIIDNCMLPADHRLREKCKFRGWEGSHCVPESSTSYVIGERIWNWVKMIFVPFPVHRWRNDICTLSRS